MSVYPVLKLESLKERCEKDILQFMSEQGLRENPNPQELSMSFSSKEEIKAKINALKPKFDNGDDVKYVDTISQVFDSAKQQQLWIARTYLVYQLLIVLTLSLQIKSLYNVIFTPEDGQEGIANIAFMDAVEAFLHDIKLGIFGSLTPTSDIDIGFQYSGLGEGYTPCLAYIVSRFEMLFLIFTGNSCLDFDVESYADMITVPNPDPDTQSAFPDLFYLDTGTLTWNDETKRQLLPIVFNSIVRNAKLVLGLRAQFSLDDVISLFDDTITADHSETGATESEIETYKMNIGSDITILKKDEIAIRAFEQSNTTIFDFLSKSYREQIQAYYHAVNKAENLKVDKLKGMTTIDQLRQLTPQDIIDLIVVIGNALTLRIESYTCSPTVIHVVRMLQADAQKIAAAAVKRFQGKYETSVPKEICNLTVRDLGVARCVVGKTGFILSALEQIGYMYRFHKTYCLGGAHPDPKKCKTKMVKYKNRLDHAIGNLKNAEKPKNTGGKRVNRRTYMKHAFMKSSSRYNDKHKTKKHRFKTVKKRHTKLYKKYRNSKKMKRVYMKKTLRYI